MAFDKQFYLFLTGSYLSFCAVSGMFVLVSSFNVDEGLGTWSLALGYGVSILAASATPLMGYVMGCKNLLIASEIGYALFLAGNSYTSYYTVLPAGFIFGLSEAWAWTAMPIITTYFAEKRASSPDAGKKEKHNRYYTGYMFGAAKGAAVAGNALSYVMLRVDRSLSVEYNGTHTRRLNFTYCGANDCQIANITHANKELYEPAHPLTRYVLTAFYCFLAVCGILLHAIFLPKEIQWDLRNADSGTQRELVEGQNGVHAEKLLVQGVQLAELPNSNSESADSNVNSTPLSQHKKASPLAAFEETIRATFVTAFGLKHILVASIPIYNGMVLAYCFGELTRAYTSCMMGVDKVGICVVVYSSVDCISATVTGRIAGKLGRNIPFFVAFLTNLALYSFSLAWQPNENNVWMVYIMFPMFGFANGIWVTLITALYGEYFVKEQKVAYNLWNVVTNVGFVIQFSISTALCVRAKLYLLIGVMCFAVTTYGLSQFIYFPKEVCRWRIRRPNQPQMH